MTADVDSETTLWKALLDDVMNDDDDDVDAVADEAVIDVDDEADIEVDDFIVDVDVEDELDENIWKSCQCDLN